MYMHSSREIGVDFDSFVDCLIKDVKILFNTRRVH